MTRRIVRAAGIASGLLGALVAVLVARALALPSRQLHPAPAPRLAVDAEAAAARLAASLRFATVSRQVDAETDRAPFEAFQRWLAESYPAMHAALSHERISSGALLYTWNGRRPDLEPLLLLAHQDVVPADPAGWSHPPFAGEVADGFVWGRGAIDDKGSLVAICEAIEGLVARGFAPERSVLVAFGQDEEVGGEEGAQRVAELLASRGVRASLAIDEGMGLLSGGLVPGLESPVAGIAIAEKGYATLELRASAAGGHSSTPPRHTAVGTLANAVGALERDQMPARLGDVTRGFFAYLAPEMPLWLRVPLANAGLFAPLVTPLVGGQPALNALFRTTTAPTMLAAGTKDNVLPTRATATVNFRILPGDSVQDVVDHAQRAIADPTVEVVLLGGAREPSPVSPTGDDRFAMLQRTIGEIFPTAIVAPALTLGGTDARYYASVTDHLYRFAPQLATPADLKRIHGIDERMSVASFADAVRFYTRFIENASAP